MLSIANIDPRLVGAVIFVFGLMIGSFLNVVIYRLPAEESIVWPGSHCPKCNRSLHAWENIPVLSWLFLRGRCHTCRSPISWRYPAIELLTGGLYWAVFAAFGFTAQTAFLLVFVSLLVAIFWIDFDTQYIFDQTTFPGVALGLLYSYFITHQFWQALAAALYAVAAVSLVYGLSWLILREEGIGGGDLTLVAMIGAWLGLKGMILALMLGVLFGALMGMVMVFVGYVRDRFWPPVALAFGSTLVFFTATEALYRFALPMTPRWEMHAAFGTFAALVGASLGYFYTRSTRDRDTEKPRIPFGPALVLGGMVSLFWGDALFTWYMTQMGPI
ncbi:MAG: pilD [Cyanobacteria bacterium RYN_339]|nr:pilD [Cyanobacteria bacterium RYN_339]